MEKKGQLSIVNMMFYVVLVIMGAILTPILADFAGQAATTANSTAGTLLASAIVPFFWIGIILTFFIYVIPTGLGRQ